MGGSCPCPFRSPDFFRTLFPSCPNYWPPQLESLLQRERQLLLCRMDPNDLSPLRKRQLALLAEIIRSEPGKARESKYTPFFANFPPDTNVPHVAV